MKNIILTFFISNLSTGYLVEKRSENFGEVGNINFDLPSDFGDQIRKRINEIRLCHNEFDSGTVVSDHCLQETTKTPKRRSTRKRFRFKKIIRNLLNRRKLTKNNLSEANKNSIK